MALDEPARHISSFFVDHYKQSIAENTVTANSHNKLVFITQESLTSIDYEVLILNLNNYTGFLNLGIPLKQPSKYLILMDEGKSIVEHQNLTSGMQLIFENETLQVYKQT